jgi:hypothetical protein
MIPNNDLQAAINASFAQEQPAPPANLINYDHHARILRELGELDCSWTFAIKENPREFVKWVGKSVGLISVVFIAPGVANLAYKDERINPKTVLAASCLFWCKIGSEVIPTVIGGMAICLTGRTLYVQLTKAVKTESTLTAWKIARLDIFIKHRLIPDNLQDHEFFEDLICPISGQAIRYPVRTPFSPHIYEAADLFAWLKDHKTCPMTRKTLTPEMVRPEIEIYNSITNFLKRKNIKELG